MNGPLTSIVNTVIFSFAFYGLYCHANTLAYYLIGTVMMTIYLYGLILLWSECNDRQ